jgi:hypothetical protein
MKREKEKRREKRKKKGKKAYAEEQPFGLSSMTHSPRVRPGRSLA